MQAKAIDKLFARFDAALTDRGYLAMGGQIIDATMVPAPKQRNTGEEMAAIKQGKAQRAAVAYSLIQTCRLNDVDPQAWLADVLGRIADHPISRLDELLPWNWRSTRLALAA